MDADGNSQVISMILKVMSTLGQIDLCRSNPVCHWYAENSCHFVPSIHKNCAMNIEPVTTQTNFLGTKPLWKSQSLNWETCPLFSCLIELVSHWHVLNVILHLLDILARVICLKVAIITAAPTPRSRRTKMCRNESWRHTNDSSDLSGVFWTQSIMKVDIYSFCQGTFHDKINGCENDDRKFLKVERKSVFSCTLQNKVLINKLL